MPSGYLSMTDRLLRQQYEKLSDASMRSRLSALAELQLDNNPVVADAAIRLLEAITETQPLDGLRAQKLRRRLNAMKKRSLAAKRREVSGTAKVPGSITKAPKFGHNQRDESELDDVIRLIEDAA